MRCFSTVISGMFGLLEKCKESEGVLSRVRGYGRRGVIRKARSRAGKFKDHDGEGVGFYPSDLLLTHGRILYQKLFDISKSKYYRQNLSKQHRHRAICDTASWAVSVHLLQYKDQLVLWPGSGLQLHAFLVRPGISFSPGRRPAVTYQ